MARKQKPEAWPYSMMGSAAYDEKTKKWTIDLWLKTDTKATPDKVLEFDTHREADDYWTQHVLKMAGA